MIELFEQDIRTFDRHSSKGNQLKWENNGVWYKADYAGYEGLSEYTVSNLLKHSSLNEDEYINYELEEIKYRNTVYTGAKSRDLKTDDWQIITLERLFKQHFGESLHRALWGIQEVRERLNFLCAETERITGLKDFGPYLSKLITIDALFLNEDRHTHNIAVLMNEKEEYKLCPIFDNGASLLSDTTMDYPLTEDLDDLIASVNAKTVSDSFDEQLDVAEELFGQPLYFNFNTNDVESLLREAAIYSDAERKRVKDVLDQQRRKYKYLFKGFF